jgi:hypothetical protein
MQARAAVPLGNSLRIRFWRPSLTRGRPPSSPIALSTTVPLTLAVLKPILTEYGTGAPSSPSESLAKGSAGYVCTNTVQVRSASYLTSLLLGVECLWVSFIPRRQKMSRKLAVVFLAMLVLVGAMGLKTVVTAHGDGSAIMANGAGPAPATPYKNGAGPAPATPYKNGAGPAPATPY